MKTIKKALRIEFIDYAKETLKAYGFRYIGNDYYTAESRKGTFKLKLPPQQDQNVCFSAFGRFDYLSDLTGTFNHKYNFHHLDMSMFENYIGQIIGELKNMSDLEKFISI